MVTTLESLVGRFYKLVCRNLGGAAAMDLTQTFQAKLIGRAFKPLHADQDEREAGKVLEYVRLVNEECGNRDAAIALAEQWYAYDLEGKE